MTQHITYNSSEFTSVAIALSAKLAATYNAVILSITTNSDLKKYDNCAYSLETHTTLRKCLYCLCFFHKQENHSEECAYESVSNCNYHIRVSGRNRTYDL